MSASQAFFKGVGTVAEIAGTPYLLVPIEEDEFESMGIDYAEEYVVFLYRLKKE